MLLDIILTCSTPIEFTNADGLVKRQSPSKFLSSQLMFVTTVSRAKVASIMSRKQKQNQKRRENRNQTTPDFVTSALLSAPAHLYRVAQVEPPPAPGLDHLAGAPNHSGRVRFRVGVLPVRYGNFGRLQARAAKPRFVAVVQREGALNLREHGWSSVRYFILDLKKIVSESVERE